MSDFVVYSRWDICSGLMYGTVPIIVVWPVRPGGLPFLTATAREKGGHPASVGLDPLA